MPAPDIIKQLVKRFDEQHASYISGRYNEAQLRQEFLNPFFEALGWDLFNRQGYAEAYKEAIHEASQEVEGATKAPDYAFRIGGTRKFFVEAKKPSVNIKYDIVPAFQLRHRYLGLPVVRPHRRRDQNRRRRVKPSHPQPSSTHFSFFHPPPFFVLENGGGGRGQ